jgi:hypothetical protein
MHNLNKSCINYMSHRVSIGIFYSRVYSIVRKKMFFLTKFKSFCNNLNLLFHASCILVVHIVMNYMLKSFYTNLSFTMILLILILLDNDIANTLVNKICRSRLCVTCNHMTFLNIVTLTGINHIHQVSINQ